MSGDRVYVVLVTAPPGDAERLARALVERRLAAGVNVVPGLRSVYWWEGRVEEAGESLLIIKTSASALEDLLEAVKELHPYEVPEAIALPVEACLGEYLEWVLREVRGGGRSGGAEAS